MKAVVCGSCGHIEFDEAPEKCPVCASGKSAFAENPDAINKAADPLNPTDADRKHTPRIVVVKDCGLIHNGACTDVHVVVGEIEHVMEQEHYIRYIDYYLDRKFIAKVWLSPEVCNPAAALHLKVRAGSVITALESCNVHGNWISEVSI